MYCNQQDTGQFRTKIPWQLKIINYEILTNISPSNELPKQTLTVDHNNRTCCDVDGNETSEHRFFFGDFPSTFGMLYERCSDYLSKKNKLKRDWI